MGVEIEPIPDDDDRTLQELEGYFGVERATDMAATHPCPACGLDTDNLSVDAYLAIQEALGPGILVAAGLMTNVPPYNCPKDIRAKTCVHHSPDWIRIRHRLSCNNATREAPNTTAPRPPNVLRPKQF